MTSLIDEEKFLKIQEIANTFSELTAPNNKVPALNLPKLAPDKKTIPIEIDVAISKDFVLRDRFDWELGSGQGRPVDFATCLIMELPDFDPAKKGPKKTHYAPHLTHIKLSEAKMAAVKRLENEILRQINEHIDKNTFFPRQRLNKKEEDLVMKHQICVKCDSILTGPVMDFCY